MLPKSTRATVPRVISMIRPTFNGGRPTAAAGGEATGSGMVWALAEIGAVERGGGSVLGRIRATASTATVGYNPAAGLTAIGSVRDGLTGEVG
jgi:hypothetical protein